MTTARRNPTNAPPTSASMEGLVLETISTLRVHALLDSRNVAHLMLSLNDEVRARKEIALSLMDCFITGGCFANGKRTSALLILAKMEANVSPVQ